jgi:pimeloyl-ACP methyl ester carboxylesterase
LRFAYHDWGDDGLPLLVFHGNSFHSRVWDPVARAFQPELRALSFDLRGHGDSDKPATSYERQFFVADIVAIVEALGLNNPPVVGHSLGAVSSLSAAGMHPGVLGPLVLVEPIIRPKPDAANQQFLPVHDLASRARNRRHVWPSRQDIYESYRPRVPFNSWDDEVLRGYVDYGFADRDDGQVELKCSGETEGQVYEIRSLIEPWSLLPNLTVPVLVLQGAESAQFKLERATEFVASMPDGRLISIPDATHSLPMEKPVLVAELAKTFLLENLLQAGC